MLTAFMIAHNEADYIEYSIRSVIDCLDLLIVIEGATRENYSCHGNMRSTDGTIDILKKLQEQYRGKLFVFYNNENTQLEQRNLYFAYMPQEKHIMLLLDSDEIYAPKDIQSIRESVNKNEIPWPSCLKMTSQIFINDFYNVSRVEYPRIWTIDPKNEHRFVEPNRILVNGGDFPSYKTDIEHFHYAYCKSPKRFREKRRERLKVHNIFPWNITSKGIVYRQDADIRPFDGKHPEIMNEHSLFGVRKHKKIDEPETICMTAYSGIGNLIHTTPCLQALRKLKPDANIYLLTHQQSARILEGTEDYDIIIGNQSHFISTLRRLDHLLIVPAGGYTEPATRQKASNILETKVKIFGKSESEYIMDYARKLGYTGEMPHSEITVFEQNKKNVRRLLESQGLTPGEFITVGATYKHEHQWPLKHLGDNKWVDIINEAKQFGLPFVLLGTEEDTQCEYIAEKTGAINLSGFSRDIKDVAALIGFSRCFIGNDGGLGHIAAALRKPSVVCFTFTSILKNRPMHSNTRIVANPCDKRVSCQHGNYKQCKGNGCLDIPVEKVINKMAEIF